VTHARHARDPIRVASVALALGTALAIVVDVLHPRPASFENHPEPFFEKVAASEIWLPVHMGLLLASLLVLAGQAALTWSIRERPAALWARFGLVLAVASNAVLAVWLAFDGLGTKHVAEQWVEARPEDKEAAFRVGSALERVNFGLDSLWFTLFWGLTFVVYGIALLLSARYPRWTGWVALIGGIGATVTSQVQIAQGLSSWTLALDGAFAAVQAPGLLFIAFTLWRRGATDAAAP
jgi:hypothetical protein